MPHDYTMHGIVGLAVFQLSKTAREWYRDWRRDRRLMSEIREAREQATEARIQAASVNRKLYKLEQHLEGNGVITPDPTKSRRSDLDPVTVIGRSPLLGPEEET